MEIFYLHGFASSAQSSKAAYFAGKLRDRGITLRTPDFNAPDFSTLTITRMVGQVVREIGGLPSGPVTLIGSSLGAFVALQAAAQARLTTGHGSTRFTTVQPGSSSATVQHGSTRAADKLGATPATGQTTRVGRLVLLAPALDFGRRRDFALGDRSHQEWERTGTTNVFHYGYGRMFPVHYELYRDACGYECENLELDVPIQIFQGRNDTVVDPAAVEQWAHRRENVELHLVDDDHQLGGSLEYIWREMGRFLALH